MVLPAASGIDFKSPKQLKSSGLGLPKNDSVVSASSDRPLNNSSGFSGPSDFKTTLRSRIDAPVEKAEPKQQEIEGRDPSVEDGEAHVSLNEASDETPQTPKVPIYMAPKGQPASIAVHDPDAMSHRLAWTNFLQKMKEKLGVSASHLMAAFKSLTKEELAQPPEQNIAKLVAQLGLSDQQATLAQQFFKELIVRTDAKPLGEELKTTDQATLAAVSQREMTQARTEQALKQMNQQFFMKSPAMQQAMTEAASPAKNQDILKTASTAVPETAQDVSAQAPAKSDRAILPAMEGGMAIPPGMMQAPETTEVPVDTNAPKAMKAPVEKMSKLNTTMLDEDTAPTAGRMPVQDLMLPKFAPKTQAAMLPNMMPTAASTSATPMPAAPIAAMPVLPKPIFSGTPDQNVEEGEDQTAMASTEGEEQAVGATPFTLNTQSSGEVAHSKAPGAQPLSMPVHDLVEQAHIMVKDGGGEMRVVLQPEGLGEVVMKVSVNGDKVNVQAITQSDEAKRVLESGFKTLKDGLNVHKLNLEGIKVDTMQSLGKQMEQQYQDSQRQQARGFLEQFHQGRDQWRQGYFDIAGADGYRSTQKQRPDAPLSASAARANSGASRRLNLVA